MPDTQTRDSAQPFIHEIRVTWGDCDPAKIVYTARLPWFALDAINAWWEQLTGGEGWFQMELDRNVGSPFVHMSMDFLAPVTPRHRLLCQVDVVRLGETSIEFLVTGRQAEKVCFEGRFVCVFVTADSFRKQKPPQEIIDLITPLLRSAALSD